MRNRGYFSSFAANNQANAERQAIAFFALLLSSDCFRARSACVSRSANTTTVEFDHVRPNLSLYDRDFEPFILDLQVVISDSRFTQDQPQSLKVHSLLLITGYS